MRSKSAYRGLACSECSEGPFKNGLIQRCKRCGGLLDTLLDVEELRENRRESPSPRRSSMWRFAAFLPIRPTTRIISAGEGGTPLRELRSVTGRVWIKDETRNPTGSFKDRGASLAVTILSGLGVQKIALSSEGNAGASFSLYAQMTGIASKVFLPKHANTAKAELTEKLGAKVTRVSGTIGDAGREAAKWAEKAGAYNASTFVTPYRHDGKGTMALEICEQKDWRPPDWVVYPIGGGVGLIGMWKIFKLLHEIGWIPTRPRFVGVQASGCAPVVKAFNSRNENVEDWKSPKTLALGLKIPRPLAGRWILRSLRESKGVAVQVSDMQIRKSIRTLAKSEGLLLEPSSAAAFAALPELYENKVIEKSEEVVVIGTGSGLKTIENL